MVPAIERERERVELLRVHALQCVFELQVEVINVEEERMWIEKRGGRRRREEVEGEERMWIEKRGGGRRREEVEGEERRWKEKRRWMHQSTGCGELPNLGGRLARHIYISAPL